MKWFCGRLDESIKKRGIAKIKTLKKTFLNPQVNDIHEKHIIIYLHLLFNTLFATFRETLIFTHRHDYSHKRKEVCLLLNGSKQHELLNKKCGGKSRMAIGRSYVN